MNTEGKYIANKRVKLPYSWAKTTVYQILSNPVYLGKLVSQRYTTRSFKDKRIVERPPEEWVIVENTHEPLVDQATFDTVQERIKIKQPAMEMPNSLATSSTLIKLVFSISSPLSSAYSSLVYCRRTFWPHSDLPERIHHYRDV